MITLGMLRNILRPNTLVTIFNRAEDNYILEHKLLEEAPTPYFYYSVVSITPVAYEGLPELEIDISCTELKYYSDGLYYTNWFLKMRRIYD